MDKENLYWLAAKDEQGKTFLWGFFFPSIEKAKRALLPDTWVIDENGKKVAEYGKP